MLIHSNLYHLLAWRKQIYLQYAYSLSFMYVHVSVYISGFNNTNFYLIQIHRRKHHGS